MLQSGRAVRAPIAPKEQSSHSHVLEVCRGTAVYGEKRGHAVKVLSVLRFGPIPKAGFFESLRLPIFTFRCLPMLGVRFFDLWALTLGLRLRLGLRVRL